MANITHEQLIEYDARIKSYINNAINSKITYYEQRIQELNVVINKLQDTITELEKTVNNENNNNIIHSDTDSNTSDIVISPPLLRSVPIVKSIKPESIEVQEDIEEDYIVYDRVIYPNDNKQYKNIVVTTDDRSNRLWFSMWKTFDDRPLSIGKQISVIWINAEGHKGESLCGDIQILPNSDGDRLYFSWDIPDRCTVKAGTIRFAIRITNLDGYPEYAWHTLPAEIQCMQGLMDGNWEDTPDAQESVDWADYIEDKWAQLLIIIDRADYDAIVDKPEIVYVVKEPDGKVRSYLGDTEIKDCYCNEPTMNLLHLNYEPGTQVLRKNFTREKVVDGRETDVRYDPTTEQLQQRYADSGIWGEWEDIVRIPQEYSAMNNIVMLSSREYAELEKIDPDTLYLLND